MANIENEIHITAIFLSYLRRNPRQQELKAWQGIYAAERSLESLERRFLEEYKVEIAQSLLQIA